MTFFVFYLVLILASLLVAILFALSTLGKGEKSRFRLCGVPYPRIVDAFCASALLECGNFYILIMADVDLLILSGDFDFFYADDYYTKGTLGFAWNRVKRGTAASDGSFLKTCVYT